MAKSSARKRQDPERRSSFFQKNNATEEKVGDRLRELRRQRGLSMRILAEQSGVSANTLSLIETGKTSPSVSTLQQIAVALNYPLVAFFESGENREPVIHTIHRQRRAREFPNARAEELFSGTGDERLLPFIVIFNPHSESGPQPLALEGKLFVYCLSGRVTYTIQGQDYALEPGDSLVFSGQLPHSWAISSEKNCEVIIVVDRSAR